MISRILLVASGSAVMSTIAAAQAPAPIDHPSYRLAQAIEAQGCSLTEEATNLVLFEAGIQPGEFPPMAIMLVEEGRLVYSGEGTLTLVNWGTCTGDLPIADSDDAEVHSE